MDQQHEEPGTLGAEAAALPVRLLREPAELP